MVTPGPFKAIFVTVEGQAANKLGTLKVYARELGADFVASMDTLFNDLFVIMTDRIISELKDVMWKTKEASKSTDAAMTAYRLGHKLDAAIDLAKKIQTGFCEDSARAKVAPCQCFVSISGPRDPQPMQPHTLSAGYNPIKQPKQPKQPPPPPPKKQKKRARPVSS